MPVLREGRAIIMALLVPNSWCGSAAQHGLISCLGGVGEYISDHRDFATSRLRMMPHGEGYHGPGPPPPTTRALPAVYKLRRRPRSISCDGARAARGDTDQTQGHSLYDYNKFARAAQNLHTH
jgi:hypothetical protein